MRLTSSTSNSSGSWSLVAAQWIIVSAAAVLATLALPWTGTGHIVREAPWHPVAAAYLRSLFYLNLRPVNWGMVASEYDARPDPGYGLASVYEAFEAAGGVTGIDHVSAIGAAIDQKDPLRLYSATTRAVSQLTRAHLARAAEELRQPGAALESVLRAERIYRVFGQDFIPQADPEAIRRLGRAWLTLASSVGHAGVLRVGGLASNLNAFSKAREQIEDYLVANYEVASFGPREKFWPLPESRLSADPGYQPPPWIPPGSNFNDQDPFPRLVLNFEERGIDEKDLFLVAYGDMLFDSPQIFGEPARSLGLTCSVCHNRSDINRGFFLPGISHRHGAVDVDGSFFNPRFNDRRFDSLDIPSLRGLRFTGPYGRDGRFGSLRNFTRNVMVNEFAGPEPTPLMLDAIVTYMLEFDWLPAPYLNPDGSLVDSATPEAKRGEELFSTPFQGMGGRACDTCHVRSANFMDGLRHDIGTGADMNRRGGARDEFFETPTLIGVAHTAPYFHNGSQEDLAGVVGWFDQRFNLDLTPQQRQDLTAYLEAVGTGEEPYEIFDEENTRFRLSWEELSTFISTLDTLLEARDALHAELLIRTVADDLRLDASGLQDLAQAPRVHELADKLDTIGAAIQQDAWDRAAALWSEYQDLEAEYGPDLR